MALSAGTRLGPYEILAPLGAGGMGEVYRARDPRLDREVAVKVLPETSARDAERLRRLEREARAASALNHPNIVTIHDIGDHEGTLYVAMEYVEGKTLREMLREQPLPAKRLLQLATQIAGGLAKAHSAGIVHRDLKPENLMVTADGLVKILDFGLAKLELESPEVGSEARTLSKVTREGTVLGTVQYMSPEQAAGRPVDYRSDQFSLGSILYEMATGKLAYPRDTGPEIQAAIMRDEPEPMGALNPHVPAQLAHIVGRCLEKDPKDRYDSTRDLARDLDSVDESRRTGLPTSRRLRLAGVAGAGLMALLVIAALALFTGDAQEWLARDRGPPRIESIAVLPLENLSGDPEQEYFADGMTEALTTDLARIRALKVISRTSAMRYKGSDKPLPQIARELNVDAVIEGSALRVGDRVRITAQLIHAETDQYLWADSYEAEFRDVLALQSQVARTIAREVKVSLTVQEDALLARARPVDPEAQDAYLRARYYLNRWPGEGWTRCEEYSRRAIEREPSFAAAHATLALCHLSLLWTQPPKEVGPRAEAAALKALELDESLSEAHSALGQAKLFFHWDWDGARTEFERAIELSPNSAHAPFGYSNYFLFAGHFDEAVAEARRALELDPASLLLNRNMTFVYLLARRYDGALAQARRTLELDPNYLMARSDIVWACARSGRESEARAEFEQLELVLRASPPLTGLLALSQALLGRRLDARESLEELEQIARQQYVDPLVFVQSHALLGDTDEALEWLETAYEGRSAMMVQLKVTPELDPLRSDPRFQDVLRRMRFPE